MSDRFDNMENKNMPPEESEKPAKSHVICAWCQKILREIEGIKGGKDSHGICQDCRNKYFPPKKTSSDSE